MHVGSSTNTFTLLPSRRRKVAAARPLEKDLPEAAKSDVFNAFPHLTADDRRILHAATGITHAADGTVVRSAGARMPAWALFIQVDGDRARRFLQGTMTSDYVLHLISRSPVGDPMLVHLQAALDVLRTREETGVRRPSSVDIRA